MIKKIIFVCFLTLLLVTNSFANGLEKILERNYIEFAVYENFPPYSYKGKDGKDQGIDIDIGKAVAKRLGVKPGFRFFQADESVDDDLRNVVWKGHYLAGGPSDVMLHVPYDENFAKENDKVIFVQPYFREVVAFAVNTSRVRSARTLEVFTDEPIGVETASLSDAYLLGAFSGRLRENVKHYLTVDDAVKAMVDAETSAVMANRGELEHALSLHEHDFVVTKLPTPGLSVEGWELCAATSTENQKLAEKIHSIINELKISGELKAIFEAHNLTYGAANSGQIYHFKEDEE